MCSEAIIRNGPICDRVGALSAALGVSPIMAPLYEWEPLGTDCLCGVDVPAMAAACDPPLRCVHDPIADQYFIDFEDLPDSTND